jgi:hypothetical protein
MGAVPTMTSCLGIPMYEKPKLVCFGRLRDLTQLGLNHDCDGGIQGITAGVASATDGSWLGCRTS